jgi:AcrR family transcriptional regulator
MARIETTTTDRLSRERILEAASGIVEQDGLESLSMRRLAQELDVWPMSVYRYFRDKAELVDAIVDRATAEIGKSEGAGGPWKERLRSLLGETRSTLAEQPPEFRARFAAPELSPAAVRVTEAGLGALRDAGFSREAAASGWRGLLAYTIGFASLKEGDGEGFDHGLGLLLDGLEQERAAGS